MKFESDYDFEKANEQFAETLQGLTKQMKKVKVGEGAISPSFSFLTLQMRKRVWVAMRARMWAWT